jgi:putative FmdB family regulatory protein
LTALASSCRLFGVPTYEYECSQCGRRFEVRQRISEPPLESCSDCGGTVQRLLGPATFILKGSGFYVNDYPSESRKKGISEEKKGAGESGSSSSSAPAGSGSAPESPASKP